MVGDKNNHLFKVGRAAFWVMAELETVLLSQVERQLTDTGKIKRDFYYKSRTLFARFTVQPTRPVILLNVYSFKD